MGGFWTDERVALLRKAAREGATFAEAARVIGAGCTRDMVAGKAHRLGVSFPATFAKLSAASKASSAKQWATKRARGGAQ